MARSPRRAPAYIILSTWALCGLITDTETAAAQDTWMLFQKDERARRAAPAAPEGSGPQGGDRPLEPKGGRDRTAKPQSGSGRAHEAPSNGPRGAGPMAVERQELAPVAEPSPVPATAGSRAPPSPRWDAVPPSVPHAPIPPPPRESGFSPAARPPIQPAAPLAPALQAPLPRTTARPSLDGLAALPPKSLEDIVDGIELPLKSAAIAALWPEPWRAPSGTASPAFEAIRIEVLRRAGAIAALRAVLDRMPPPTEPVLAIVVLRAHLLVGNRDAGCALAGEAIRNRATLPANFRRDAILAAGYCALAGGNADAARLTVDLVRGEGLDAPFALAVLQGKGAGKSPPSSPSSIGVLDYRIGEVAGLAWPSAFVDRAEPAVLAVAATAPTIEASLRILAAERAARLHLLTPEALAEQYRSLPVTAAELSNPLGSKHSGALRRALMMQATEAEAAADKKARLIAALLDDARKAGIRTPVARMLGPALEGLRPVPELAWLADDAAEVLVYAGRASAVDGWADLTRDLDHWRALGALASDNGVPSSTALASIERLARMARISPPRLHRLVTVFDALDVQLPIPLWEAASRTPQPTDGHLPPTGVLSELKSASDRGEGGLVILRAAQAMGPANAADANLLALGDVIRALKKIGLTQEARALGIEALIEAWPTVAGR